MIAAIIGALVAANLGFVAGALWATRDAPPADPLAYPEGWLE